MSDTVMPYLTRNPRDLITAEDWNQVQILIRGDIKTQVEKALDELQTVPKAGDTGKLDGKTRAELAKEIIDAALQAMNQRTGYMRVFRRLKKEESLIKHELKDFPVVDVYQLEWFDVICFEDDLREKHKALFYLYHSSEKRLRIPNETGSLDIEGPSREVFKIPFEKMLSLYNVAYDDDTSLGDLETEFWQAFSSSPNEEFDDDTHCHSPWWDRCCGEKRSVGDIKKRGDWDEIWFQTRPVKTVNANQPTTGSDIADDRRPVNVRIRQYDFDTLGARVLDDHVFPTATNAQGIPQHLLEEMPVMLLLKV